MVGLTAWAGKSYQEAPGSFAPMTGCAGCDHRYSELKSYLSCSITQRQALTLQDMAAVCASKEQITQMRLDTALYPGGREAPGPDGSVRFSSG